MKSTASTPKAYIAQLPEVRKGPLQNLRQTILEHLDPKFAVCPDGYHCNPTLPLPFMNLASQKNFIAVYHMGMYAKKEILNWFVAEYPNHCSTKLDMGKSCVRFKNMNDIPYALIGQLAAKLSVDEWISLYESQIKR
jgi:hypothetical protein